MFLNIFSIISICMYIFTDLTAERVLEFIPQFLSKIHIESLVHGNMTMSEAIDMVHIVESKLTTSIPHMVPLLPKQMVLKREIKLEDGNM